MMRSLEKRFLSLASLLLCAGLLFAATQSLFIKLAVPALAEEGFTVVIDAGHGGIDSGTVGVNGALEKDLNLAFAEMLAAIFREAGVRVVMTRSEDALVLKEGDENAPSKKARDLANRLAVSSAEEGALLISIHMNSFPVEKYAGFEAYYSENHPDSILYARAIAEAVKEKHEPENRRPVKRGKDIYLLKNSQNPAVLLECGFLSNAGDAAKLSDKDYQKELCFSIFYAIMDVRENKTAS